MSRLVWGLGVGGLALALLAAPWLGSPGDERAAEVEPVTSVLVPGVPMTASSAPAPSTDAVPPRAPPHPDSVPAASPRLVSDGGRAARRWPSQTRASHRLSEPRQRIVNALRAPHDSPLQRRDAVLAALADSGASPPGWTERGSAALDTWRDTLSREVLPVRAEPTRCYAAGCVTRITFPDALSYDEARQRIPELELAGVGAHMQLPPEHLSSGEVSVSWAVLPPEPR